MREKKEEFLKHSSHSEVNSLLDISLHCEKSCDYSWSENGKTYLIFFLLHALQLSSASGLLSVECYVL